MTKKKEALSETEKARRAFSSYISRLGARLEEEDCPSSVLAEARKFFEGQGVSLDDFREDKPAEDAQKGRVLELIKGMGQRSG